MTMHDTTTPTAPREAAETCPEHTWYCTHCGVNMNTSQPSPRCPTCGGDMEDETMAGKSRIKCRRDYYLAATAFAPRERVRVTGKEVMGPESIGTGETWYHIRFADGSAMTAHPSHFEHDENGCPVEAG